MEEEEREFKKSREKERQQRRAEADSRVWAYLIAIPAPLLHSCSFQISQSCGGWAVYKISRCSARLSECGGKCRLGLKRISKITKNVVEKKKREKNVIDRNTASSSSHVSVWVWCVALLAHDWLIRLMGLCHFPSHVCWFLILFSPLRRKWLDHERERSTTTKRLGIPNHPGIGRFSTMSHSSFIIFSLFILIFPSLQTSATHPWLCECWCQLRVFRKLLSSSTFQTRGCLQRFVFRLTQKCSRMGGSDTECLWKEWNVVEDQSRVGFHVSFSVWVKRKIQPWLRWTYW